MRPRFTGGRTSGGLWARFVAYALLAALGAAPRAVVAQDSSGAAGAGEVFGAAAIERLERAFAALEAIVAGLPRDAFDLEARVRQGAPDAATLFAWVRDHTALVPYRGALRGPVGVLMDRRGNSLDRALLLAELLRLRGYDTRLARTQLSEVETESLLGGLGWPAPLAAARDGEDERQREAEAALAEVGLDEEQRSALLDGVARQRDEMAAAAEERVATQTGLLTAALGLDELDAGTERATHLEALRDHWWVQYREGDAWRDLDPALSFSQPGIVLGEVAETFVATTVGDLPEALRHTLRIRVVLECFGEGALREHPVVESPVLLPADLLGQEVAVLHVPVRWPADLDLAAVDAPEAELRRAALEQDDWVTALRVGSEVFYDRAFDDACRLRGAQQALDGMGRLGAGVAESLGGVTGLFGGLPGGEASPEPTTDALPTALWLEYTIGSPGREDEVLRRQVFDLVGPAARAAGVTALPPLSDEQRLAWRLALLGQTSILPLAFDLHPQFVDLLTASRLLSWKDVLLAVAREPAQARTLLAEDGPAALPSLPSGLYALALARTGLRDGSEVYLDRPNVLTQHRQLAAREGGLVTVVAYDIVANHVGVHPLESSAFAARLRQGVLDTNAEALLAAIGCPGDATALCTPGDNAADTLARSALGWTTWTALRTLEELEALELGWSVDALARLRADLTGGFAVIVPSASVDGETTWWRVDPLTGQTLGMGSSGWGSVSAEHTLVLNCVSTVLCYGLTIANAEGRGGSPVRGLSLCVMGLIFGYNAAVLSTGATAALMNLIARLLWVSGPLVPSE